MKDTDKITMTLSQLKKLVRESRKSKDMDESYEARFSEFADEEKVVVSSLDKISHQLSKVLSSAKYGSKDFQSSIESALNSINSAKKNYML